MKGDYYGMVTIQIHTFLNHIVDHSDSVKRGRTMSAMLTTTQSKLWGSDDILFQSSLKLHDPSVPCSLSFHLSQSPLSGSIGETLRSNIGYRKTHKDLPSWVA